MKAIKDCSYKVKIEKNYVLPQYWWTTYSKQTTGLDQELGMEGNKGTIELAKRDWEKFAKINKIKKWKFIR